MGHEMEIAQDAVSFLRNTRDQVPPELRDFFVKFEELYDRKLWHQLTMLLERFVNTPSAGPFLMPVYQNFIAEWEKKMNKLKIVEFVTKTAKQLKDPKESLAFLLSQCEKLVDNEEAKDAYVLCSMEAAHYKLVVGDYEGCKETMEKCEKILDGLTSVDPVINASFYRVSADYYKTKANYPQYYKNALLFLSSVSLDELSSNEKVERAFDLAISALLGDGVYNFGELLLHPILDSLQGGPFSWLRELPFAFNTGDMDAFDRISRSAPFLQQQLLTQSLAFLREKLCLMTLVENAFKKSKEERGKIPFAAIEKECRVNSNEVEHLVMKALSLGLIKGSIDEIEKIVNITWIQPRVLDKGQIATIKAKLDEWNEKVRQHVLALEAEGHGEVFNV